MKTIQRHLLPSILAVLFIAVSAGRTLAYDHDDKGWFDEHHHHHPFIVLTAEYSAACSGDECRQTFFGEANVIPRSLLRGEFIQHNGHRGYWDHDKNGVQIFINI